MAQNRKREWEPLDDPVVQAGAKMVYGVFKLAECWYLFTIYAALIGGPLLLVGYGLYELIVNYPEAVRCAFIVLAAGTVVVLLARRIWARWCEGHRRREGRFWSVRDRNGSWHGGEG